MTQISYYFWLHLTSILVFHSAPHNSGFYYSWNIPWNTLQSQDLYICCHLCLTFLLQMFWWFSLYLLPRTKYLSPYPTYTLSNFCIEVSIPDMIILGSEAFWRWSPYKWICCPYLKKKRHITEYLIYKEFRQEGICKSGRGPSPKWSIPSSWMT